MSLWERLCAREANFAREAMRSRASLAKSASFAPIIQSITNNQSHDLVGEAREADFDKFLTFDSISTSDSMNQMC